MTPSPHGAPASSSLHMCFSVASSAASLSRCLVSMSSLARRPCCATRCFILERAALSLCRQQQGQVGICLVSMCNAIASTTGDASGWVGRRQCNTLVHDVKREEQFADVLSPTTLSSQVQDITCSLHAVEKLLSMAKDCSSSSVQSFCYPPAAPCTAADCTCWTLCGRPS